jgi:hypothetical protein
MEWQGRGWAPLQQYLHLLLAETVVTSLCLPLVLLQPHLEGQTGTLPHPQLQPAAYQLVPSSEECQMSQPQAQVGPHQERAAPAPPCSSELLIVCGLPLAEQICPVQV